eukprot:7081180-Ditylum_brightwellii.AAC.1
MAVKPDSTNSKWLSKRQQNHSTGTKRSHNRPVVLTTNKQKYSINTARHTGTTKTTQCRQHDKRQYDGDILQHGQG